MVFLCALAVGVHDVCLFCRYVQTALSWHLLSLSEFQRTCHQVFNWRACIKLLTHLHWYSPEGRHDFQGASGKSSKVIISLLILAVIHMNQHKNLGALKLVFVNCASNEAKAVANYSALQFY
jgi:hypothetical protein